MHLGLQWHVHCIVARGLCALHTTPGGVTTCGSTRSVRDLMMQKVLISPCMPSTCRPVDMQCRAGSPVSCPNYDSGLDAQWLLGRLRMGSQGVTYDSGQNVGVEGIGGMEKSRA